MILDFARLVEQEVRESGYRPMPPVGSVEIAELQRRSVDQLGFPLPDDYLEFISSSDGFYISSMQLFASQQRPLVFLDGKEDSSVSVDNVIKMNLEFREDRMEHENLISLVYDQMLRGWDPVAREWYSREHVRGKHRTYGSYEELLADGLWDVGV